MTDDMQESYCFITPTYAGDIERFAVLRESIMCFAPEIRHLAIVQSEHTSAFKDRFAKQPNLEIWPTSAILPAHMELQRGATRLHRRLIQLRKFLKQDYRRIDGWRAQQLTKIHALAQSPYDIGIFLDSDLFLSRPLLKEDLFSREKPRLFRSKCFNLESTALWISAADTHGIDPLSYNELHNYVFAPAVFRKSTAILLIEQMISRHGKRWELPFCREKKPSEYNLLGITTMYSSELEKYALEDLSHPEDLHCAITVDDIKPSAAARAAKQSGKPFFLIQSNTKISPEYMRKVFSELRAMRE